ncbi:uncharacterized protein LOC128337301 isoform X2 [Hemicordylus capensis]|uniref:uncharacterized protein LOC128337301 isoform X2 n=1 Tax=Hemicordylus capensis TaxID=884348 RepID=UPI002304A488|nr:uncharacterized protein LOC128337301 isoform X2 [Hemicordylus capensis]
MLLAKCLFMLSSTGLLAQLSLYQTQRFQFVGIGEKAEISCTSTAEIKDYEHSYNWYKRQNGEFIPLIENCIDEKSAERYSCRTDGRKLILEIPKVQREDSGLYLCAQNRYSSMLFSNGSSLIVGDSYTPSTWVMLLLSSAHPPPEFVQSDHLACVVHGASNLVQVSWSISGELQQEGQTLLAKNSSGSLTFINLLSVPMVDSQTSGKLYTCEVRFNSSGKSVKKSAPFPAASSADPPGSVDQCTSYEIPLVVVGLLAMLLLLLSFLWIRLHPSGLGFQHRIPEPPALESETLQEGICYAHLDFPSRSQDGNKKRRASQGKHLKI